jgi:hypothetical protein
LLAEIQSFETILFGSDVWQNFRYEGFCPVQSVIIKITYTTMRKQIVPWRFCVDLELIGVGN